MLIDTNILPSWELFCTSERCSPQCALFVLYFDLRVLTVLCGFHTTHNAFCISGPNTLSKCSWPGVSFYNFTTHCSPQVKKLATPCFRPLTNTDKHVPIIILSNFLSSHLLICLLFCCPKLDTLHFNERTSVKCTLSPNHIILVCHDNIGLA